MSGLHIGRGREFSYGTAAHTAAPPAPRCRAFPADDDIDCAIDLVCPAVRPVAVRAVLDGYAVVAAVQTMWLFAEESIHGGRTLENFSDRGWSL